MSAANHSKPFNTAAAKPMKKRSAPLSLRVTDDAQLFES